MAATRTRSEPRDFVWVAAGAAVLLALVATVLSHRVEQRRAAQIALRSHRLELVDRMRVDLAAESEAEKSAVLAITDEDSQRFADQARASRAELDRGRAELDRLLAAPRVEAGEREPLDRFSQALTDLERVDDEVLSLAVQNTNLKASRLAFGPGADLLTQIDAALADAVDRSSTAGNVARATALADDARIRALRIEAILPRHIAEESDSKMDEMEAAMASEDQGVRADLRDLAEAGPPVHASDVETALALWNELGDLRKQIVALSRANTNVRSLNLSLSRKRAAMLACQEALAALRQRIEQEPAGTTRFAPASPR